MYFLMVFTFVAESKLSAQGIITTIAGNGLTEFSGDGHPATNLALGGPSGICLDKKGNIFITNVYTARVTKLAHDTLTTVIGTGQPGYSGDGGKGDTAKITNPFGVWTDMAGYLYVTDVYYSVIRKYNLANHYISTICGTGTNGFAGDGGPAAAALLEGPHGGCADVAGNLYFADYGNHRIRKIIAATGTIVTIAGTGTNGFSGDNGPATNVDLSYPNSVCLDAYGNIYFTEHGNHRVRKIDVNTGFISTVAGNGSAGFSGDGGLAVNASLNQPNCVFIAKNGTMYISDFGNNVIRGVTTAGFISTIAGNGIYGYSGDGGYATEASLAGPTAVIADNSGYIYLADGDNSAIRKITPFTFPSAGVKQVAGTNYDLFPNPSSTGKFTLTLASQGSVSAISVLNTLGRTVFQAPVTGLQTVFDLSGNAPGMYFVQLHTDAGVVTDKVVIR
jgi:hypothetical protein